MAITQAQTEQYAMFLMRHRAQLGNVAGPFVSRLSNDDREYLLTKALERGWETRRKLTSAREVLLWWRAALEYVAKSRKEWILQYSDGDRAVPGDQLGSVC